MSEKCVWISSPGTSLIFSCAELHFPALPVHTEPAGSNPIRCSHRLFYRIGLLASRSSMTYSIQLLLSAHSLASPRMFPWSKALGLSCTCSLSKWFTKTVCFLRKSSEPVRKEMANHANQRGRVRHIRNYISAEIPQITWFELVCFSWKSQLIQAFIFPTKEWRQVWFSHCHRGNSAAGAIKPYWPALHRTTKYSQTEL